MKSCGADQLLVGCLLHDKIDKLYIQVGEVNNRAGGEKLMVGGDGRRQRGRAAPAASCVFQQEASHCAK